MQNTILDIEIQNMPRRILEQWYYHIYNRWYDWSIIFASDKNYEKFYSLLSYSLNQKKYKELKILSYCFLPNHFHLVVHNNLEEPELLSDFMWSVQNSYAKYFNIQNSQKGQLFEWRFNAKKINSQEYLKQAIAYVCFNPINHKIVKNIWDYKWTSYHQLDKVKIEKYKDLQLRELEM